MIDRRIAIAARIALACGVAAGPAVSAPQEAVPAQDLLGLPAPTLELPAVDNDAARAGFGPPEKDGIYRFGLEIPVDIHPYNAGAWSDTEQGRVWRLRLKSEGALSINLLFDAFALAAGGELRIVNDDGSMRLGPFTNADNRPSGLFATQPLVGDAITLEYREPFGSQGGFRISRVVHAFRSVFGAKSGQAGGSGACNIDVNCWFGTEHQSVKRAVALLIMGGGACSGSLLNNQRQDGRQLFLTAAHCLTVNPDAPPSAQWVFTFNFELCCEAQQLNCTSVTGANVLAQDSATDYMLLEITQTIPASAQVYYAGWDRRFLGSPQSMGIHHPMADVKKVAVDNDPLTTATITIPPLPPVQCWFVGNWEAGVTEPGSSGSPLLNEELRVIGQLLGGAAQCGFPYNDFYGRLDLSWNLGLSQFLDPDGTGIEFMDGTQFDGAPDQVAVSITGPLDVTPGTSVNLTRNVQQVGELCPGTATFDVWLSKDQVIDGGDSLLASFQAVPYGSGTVPVLVPAPPGGHYYWALRLSENPTEATFGNNEVFSTSQVLVRTVGEPDLYAIGVSGPSSVSPGDSVNVTRDILSIGDPLASFTYEIRLSADPVISTSDLLVGTFQTAVEGSDTVGVQIPGAVPPGNYYWGVRAVPEPGETNTGNNTLAGNAVFVFPGDPPELTAVSVAGPTEAVAGSTAVVQYDIANSGGAIPGSVEVSILVDDDPALGSPLTVAKTWIDMAGSGSLPVQIPDLPEGTYHFGMRVEPAEGESDTSDNEVAGNAFTLTAPSLPDLQLVMTSPPVLVAGGTSEVNYQLVDLAGLFSSDVVLEARLSADSSIDAGDALLGSATVTPGLGSISLDTPASTPSGTWYVGLNALPVAGETNVANNLAVAIGQVVVAEFRPGDAVGGALDSLSDVDEASFPAVPGLRVRFSVVVAGSGEPLQLAVREPGGGEVALGAFDAGETAEFTATAPGSHVFVVSGAALGAYSIQTLADYQGVAKKVKTKLAVKNGDTQEVLFPAMPGTILDAKIKVKKKKLAADKIGFELVEPSGASVPVDAFSSQLGKKGAKILGFPVPGAGIYRLRVSQIVGKGKPVKVTITLDHPQGDQSVLID